MAHILAILAAILFAIATLIAFTSLNGISVLGLDSAGFLCLALAWLLGGLGPFAWPATVRSR